MYLWKRFTIRRALLYSVCILLVTGRMLLEVAAVGACGRPTAASSSANVFPSRGPPGPSQ